MNLSNIIKFYRDSYQHEYNTEKVTNFYSKNVTHLYYPDTFEIVSQVDYELPADTEWAEDVFAELTLNSSEKKLVCGTFFIKGQAEVLGQPQKLFTPIYLHDAFIELKNDVFVVRVIPDSLSLNPVAVNYLNSINPAVNHEYEDLAEILLQNDNPFDFAGLVNLSQNLSEKYPEVDSSLLERRIKLNDRLSNLEFVYSSRKKSYTNLVFPDIAIGLVDKPKKSKGVINELSELSELKNSKKSLLHSIFSDKPIVQPKNAKSNFRDIVVPVSLSESQEKIIQSALSSPVTLVIGPPGTGKSFSIAALAIQAAHEGKSVLIASKNEQACQVISNKIKRDIGVNDIAVNASSARYKISVAAKLRNIGNGIGVKKQEVEAFKKLRNEVLMLKASIKRVIGEIIIWGNKEVKLGQKLVNKKSGLVPVLLQSWIKFKHSRKTPIWHLKHSLRSNEFKLKIKEKKLIKATYQDQLYNLLRAYRSELLNLEEAFLERRGNVIKEIFSEVNFDIILQALPIWICKSTDIAEIVPLDAELFDLVIIEEASQCDIASSIPLLYRTKSAVIVGDPNQLNHISFISARKEQATRAKYGIDNSNIRYRDKSILDYVSQQLKSQDNVVFLDEHYRSLPDIIDFSNKQFYSNQLQVMTSNPRTEKLKSLLIIDAEGQRNQKGENIKEAEEIIKSIEAIIDKEKSLHKSACSTIGIISPFRAQVKLLKKLVKKSIDVSFFRKHKILIGTPFSFQGEERDVVFISFTVDNETHRMTIRYLERPDVFNVSITRAKVFQKVYVSVDSNQLSENSLLAKYVANQTEIPSFNKVSAFYDEFLNEVMDYLTEQEVNEIYISQYISGVQLDLVVIIDDKIVGIDLIGFPGQFEEQLTISHIKSLERANVEVFILPYSSWYFDKAKSQKALHKFLAIPHRKK